jgi:hypothetical protein
MPKPSWEGAAGGAATGASIGASFGPWGAVAGGVIGGVSGLFMGGKKKQKKPKKLSTLDPQQQQLYQQKYDAIFGKGPLADIYNYNPQGANKVFEANVARPAYRQYQENVVPTITGQFRQGNIMNSSYTGEALARSGRDVQESLDAKRAEYLYNLENEARQAKRSGIDQILGMTTFDYQKPGPEKPSMFDQFMGKVAPAAGEYAADYFFKNRGAGAAGASTMAPTAGAK